MQFVIVLSMLFHSTLHKTIPSLVMYHLGLSPQFIFKVYWLVRTHFGVLMKPAPSVRLSVRLSEKFSYFSPLVFLDFLHEVAFNICRKVTNPEFRKKVWVIHKVLKRAFEQFLDFCRKSSHVLLSSIESVCEFPPKTACPAKIRFSRYSSTKLWFLPKTATVASQRSRYILRTVNATKIWFDTQNLR